MMKPVRYCISVIAVVAVLVTTVILVRCYRKVDSIEMLMREADEYSFEASLTTAQNEPANKELSYLSVSKYLQALAMDPDRWEILENIAGVYYRSGNSELADAYIRSALRYRMSGADRKRLLDFRNDLVKEQKEKGAHR